MKLIDAYIAKTVIKATLLTVLALSALSFVLALVEELDDVGKGDYRTWDALKVAASATPFFIYQALPLAALIGALLGMGGMANAGELTAMRAAGVSNRRILYAVLKAGLSLLVLALLIGDGLGPPLEHYGDRLRHERLHKQVTFSSRYGFWAKDGPFFINIHSLAPNGELRHIKIYRFDTQRRLREVIAAARAVHEKEGWILRQVRHSLLEQDRITTRRYKQWRWDSRMDPEVLAAALVNPQKLAIWDLYEYMRNLEQRGQSAVNYAVAFWNKLAWPFVTLGMLILALPLVMTPTRKISAGQRIFVGIVLGVVFFLLNRVFSFTVIVMNWPAMSVLIFPFGLLLAMFASMRFFSWFWPR